MTQPLIILGTGGNAHDILDIVEAMNDSGQGLEMVGFLDDYLTPGETHLGHEILGPLRLAEHFPGCRFVNAIGSDRSYTRRQEIVASTGLAPDCFATLVHPAASVSRRARLGRGSYVNHGASVGGACVIGDHVAIGPGAIVGHNSVIEDYSVVAPGAVISGFVCVGQSCYIGARASVRQQLRVGNRSLVGMGAVVLRDVLPDAVVVGNPARPM